MRNLSTSALPIRNRRKHAHAERHTPPPPAGHSERPRLSEEAGPSMPLDQQRIISETNSEGDSLDDLGDTTGTNGAATLTDSEAEAGLHGDG